MNSASLPSLKKCLIVGSCGFCASSLLVFGTVALGERWMYAHLGLAFSYAIWTLLFVLSSASVFNSLIVGPLRGARFCLLFAGAFISYAVAWCAAYFVLRGAMGEWCGSLLGAILMAAVFAVGFGKTRHLMQFSLLLFVFHSLGYFLGSLSNNALGGQSGMLSWGVFYGLFFGAGIGALLHKTQNKS